MKHEINFSCTEDFLTADWQLPCLALP